jgi:hypothetical protein
MKMQSALALRLSFACVMGLAMAACTPKHASRADADIAGSYTLMSVDGKPMPADIAHEGAALQVRSGTFIIKADGTCSTKTVFVPPSGTELAKEVSATYTKDGQTLTMRWQGAGTTIGTIDGRTFTMNNEGLVFVYRK